MSPKTIAILGSTGSVGCSALKVVRSQPGRFRVVALAAGDNVKTLAEQVREFRPSLVSTRTAASAEALRAERDLPSDLTIRHGIEGAEEVASHTDVSLVLSAMVGAAGLRPTLAAVRAGKQVAIANKESMVVAGALFRRIADEHHSTILPVDSEHSAIFQALGSSAVEAVRRLVLTASGGPFFRTPERDLSRVTPEEALAHPNWKMGPKITIDSATMMNKGLEIIEAHWLFGIPPERIDVIVHPQSIVHSMVEFVDGSLLAQLSVPDMCGPIAYAFAYPDRLDGVMPTLDLGRLRELTFFEPDGKRFPLVDLAREALRRGPTFPAVLNGANEVSVAAFLDRRIGFLDIAETNREVLSSYRERTPEHLEDFIAADTWGREQAMKRIGK